MGARPAAHATRVIQAWCNCDPGSRAWKIVTAEHDDLDAAEALHDFLHDNVMIDEAETGSFDELADDPLGHLLEMVNWDGLVQWLRYSKEKNSTT